MRSVRSVLVVPGAILALLAGACGDASEIPVATRADLAVEVDRAADLVEAGQTCQALEVVRLLESMSPRATDDEARAAVDQFTAGVRSTVTCDPDDSDDGSDDDADGDDDSGHDSGDDSGDDAEVDTGNDGDRPPPGRGRGRGRNN